MKSVAVVLLLCPLCSAEICVDNGVPCASVADTTSLLQVKSILAPGDSRAGASTDMNHAGSNCDIKTCHDKKFIKENGWEKSQGGICSKRACVDCQECSRGQEYGKLEDEFNARTTAAGHAQHRAGELSHAAAQYKKGQEVMVMQRDTGEWVKATIKEIHTDGVSYSRKGRSKTLGDMSRICPYYHSGNVVFVKSSDGTWVKSKSGQNVPGQSDALDGAGMNVAYIERKGKKVVAWNNVATMVSSKPGR